MSTETDPEMIADLHARRAIRTAVAATPTVRPDIDDIIARARHGTGHRPLLIAVAAGIAVALAIAAATLLTGALTATDPHVGSTSGAGLLDRYRAACVKAAQGSVAMPRPGGDAELDNLDVANYLRDDAGALLLLTGPRNYAVCATGGTGGVADWRLLRAGYDPAGALPCQAGHCPPGPAGTGLVKGRPPRWWTLAFGAAPPQAASVEVTDATGHTAKVPVVDGTYLVRIIHDGDLPDYEPQPVRTVRMYDAAGDPVQT
jgi:hypothetical protein